MKLLKARLTFVMFIGIREKNQLKVVKIFDRLSDIGYCGCVLNFQNVEFCCRTELARNQTSFIGGQILVFGQDELFLPFQRARLPYITVRLL